MNLKSLAKDTAIYGLSSIVGRFLNYLLVPLYTYRISVESGGYGIVTNLYAYTALFLALLTFGMETTLFRFSSREGEDADLVYGTILRMVGGVGAAFLAAVLILLKPISAAMGYDAHPEYVACMAAIVSMDAFQAIMFSRLRQQGKAVKFAILKLSFIIPNVLLNLLAFLVMPDLRGCGTGVGWIFGINLVCTAAVFTGFIPELRGLRYGFSWKLAMRLLRYALPLLLLSIVGILNQVADKILFPFLMPGDEGMRQLGIYGACVKIAMLLSLLTQAFRYAYEPIVFVGGRGERQSTLAEGTRWFIAFSLLAFLAVTVYMPVLRHFIKPDYWEGLGVVPAVMVAEIFMGIYFNLSFWYKLSDRTWWGAVLSLAGAAVMIAVNVIGVPYLGYRACALGGLCGYGTSMLLSYFIGRRVYPVEYDLRSICKYALAAFAGYGLCSILPFGWVSMAGGTVILILYALIVAKDLPRRGGSLH